MKTSEQINEIAKALSKAQGEMKAPIKDKESNFSRDGKKTRYSSIDAIWSAAQSVLPQNELCVVQDITSSGKGINVETTLIHSSGQWMTFGPFYLPAEAETAHKYASACTYSRRYSLCAALCINGDDDDDGTDANKSLTEKAGVDKNTGEVKKDAIKEALNDPLPFVPLTNLQKEKIRCLEEAISDKDWLSSTKFKANVKDFSEISAERFNGLMATLEKKVGG